MGADVVPAARAGEASTAGLSIAVELVTGRGRDWWPRPGRVFAASPVHTFAEFAEAVDVAFGRWDLGHLRMFVLPGGVQVSWSAWRAGPAFPGTRDGRSCRLALLRPGMSFAYVFDLGEDWTHLCTVTRAADTPPAPPRAPRPVGGWGNLPDQYGRTMPGEPPEACPGRGSTAMLRDLPPLLPSWGRPA
ncbi:plasmid pRiA4b ORF-3 family protein [Micromonospora sp. AMSO31t]|nr:plasmid pRiA4b ORF-3 family protein [Micromonospora sp. AMSO31t]